MSKHQKIILSITLIFIIINVFLIPLIGIAIADVSNYFPYVAGYIITILFFLFIAFAVFKKK